MPTIMPCAPGVRDRVPTIGTCPSSSARTARTARSTSTGSRVLDSEAPQCRSCGFGFLFQLLEDYYPAPATGFVVCDPDARVLAAGRGVFELTGFRRPISSAGTSLEALRSPTRSRSGSCASGACASSARARAAPERGDRQDGHPRPLPRLRRRRRAARRADAADAGEGPVTRLPARSRATAATASSTRLAAHHRERLELSSFAARSTLARDGERSPSSPKSAVPAWSLRPSSPSGQPTTTHRSPSRAAGRSVRSCAPSSGSPRPGPPTA